MGFHFKCLFYVVFLTIPNFCIAASISVYFLTPQGQKPLKEWTTKELGFNARHYKNGMGDISVQQFFDLSTQSLNWKDRAEIDLLNIYGSKPNEMIRVPRFMMVREWVIFKLKRGELSIEVSKLAKISVPKETFELSKIQKIEFTQHTTVYPAIQLKVRTNPAASRGEKLFEQNCLSCHSLPGRKAVDPRLLTKTVFDQFKESHRSYRELVLDSKGVRGLEAYRDALGSEKNEVKSHP